MKRIYLSPPHLDGNEKKYLIEAFESNWITTLGPHVDLFEKEICQKLGIGHAAALSSGTAALHLALLLAGIRPGDEVICSDLTFAASVNAITYCGASPVFIDSDRTTWNMDPLLLAEELSECRKRGKMPKAAIVVDLYGQCADYAPIQEICREYDITVIEDAAEALGADYRGRKAGTFGRFGVLSFNGNKIITTSGGGMLVSDDEAAIKRARYLASQAREPYPYYHHVEIGYNYRLSNILAAIGRAQLENLDRKIEKRKAVNRFYRKAFAGIPGVEILPETPYGKSNYWLTVILFEPKTLGCDREGIRLALEAENIEARPVWKPMHLQPVFAEWRIRGGSVSESLFEKGLCLPSGCDLTDMDLERIVEIVSRVIKTARVDGG